MAVTSVYFHPIFLEHDTGYHPEAAERLVVVKRWLEAGELDLEWITPPRADVADVARVHTRGHIETVERLARGGGGRLDMDTVVSPASFDAALHAVGAGLHATARALGEGTRSFLLVRPPGHHAGRDRGMGFCLFNNIAVAAQYAIEELGVARVLIVDWDVHHGNGTQDVFYDDPRVLFCGFHLGNHYPGTGAIAESGAGDGVGYTVNLPLPHGAGDGAVRAFFSDVLVPLAGEFRPELVLISAGYDSVAGDPLGGLTLSGGAYRWMAGTITGLCESVGAAGPVCFLEGGYDPDRVASAVMRTLEGLRLPPGEISSKLSPRESKALSDLRRTLDATWGRVLR